VPPLTMQERGRLAKGRPKTLTRDQRAVKRETMARTRLAKEGGHWYARGGQPYTGKIADLSVRLCRESETGYLVAPDGTLVYFEKDRTERGVT